ncbi:hypothetical protein, partial [Bacillus cereus]
AHPIQIPIGAEDDFIGIIDLVTMKSEIYTNDLGTDIKETVVGSDEFNAELAALDFNAEEYTELANEWREKLIEAIADFDEDIM